jgi:hypothetical protein
MKVGALQLSLNLVMFLQPLLLEILFSLEVVKILLTAQQFIFNRAETCAMNIFARKRKQK